jgi:hypothetical protein
VLGGAVLVTGEDGDAGLDAAAVVGCGLAGALAACVEACGCAATETTVFDGAGGFWVTTAGTEGFREMVTEDGTGAVGFAGEFGTVEICSGALCMGPPAGVTVMEVLGRVLGACTIACRGAVTAATVVVSAATGLAGGFAGAGGCELFLAAAICRATVPKGTSPGLDWAGLVVGVG